MMTGYIMQKYLFIQFLVDYKISLSAENHVASIFYKVLLDSEIAKKEYATTKVMMSLY